MKYLAVAFLLVLVASQAWARQVPEDFHTRFARSLSSQLNDFLEVKLRTIMREGNATLGVPVLDPLDQPEIAVELDEDLIKAEGTLTDLHADGASGYKVDVAKVSMLSRKATVGLTFPKVYAKGHYEVEGVAMEDIDVFGKGEFEVTVTDFKINAVVAVGLTPLKVKSIDLKVSLGKLDFRATGIFHDENTSVLLSEIISDMAPQVISDYHDQITGFVEELGVETANAFLEGKSISEIIGMLG